MKIFGVNFWLLYSTFIIVATIVFVWINLAPKQLLKNAEDSAFAHLLRAFVLLISGPITWLAAVVALIYRLQERLHVALPGLFVLWAFTLAFSFLSFFLLKKQISKKEGLK